MNFARLLKNTNSNFDDIIIKHYKREDVSTLLNTKLSSLKGGDFYKIMILVSEDFDRDCEKAFEKILKDKRKEFEKHSSKTKSKKSENKFQKFIDQFIILQSDVAYSASIENTRFTKVLNRQYVDFYAFEVYAIAKSQEISPESAFKQLYKV